MTAPPIVRQAAEGDRAAIAALLDAAFGGSAESRLVERLRAGGDVVLELVATERDEIVGHVLFSRLKVEDAGPAFDAVALAPLAVSPARQRAGTGSALVEAAHAMLAQAGERLSIVLGDPGYYARFGYGRERAAGFESDYAGPYLQALAWGDAPFSGRLAYAAAFAAP